jgi:hypothetical protein
VAISQWTTRKTRTNYCCPASVEERCGHHSSCPGSLQGCHGASGARGSLVSSPFIVDQSHYFRRPPSSTGCHYLIVFTGCNLWHGGRQLRYAFDSSPGLQAALAVAWRRLTTGSAHSSKSLIFSQRPSKSHGARDKLSRTNRGSN